MGKPGTRPIEVIFAKLLNEARSLYWMVDGKGRLLNDPAPDDKYFDPTYPYESFTLALANVRAAKANKLFSHSEWLEAGQYLGLSEDELMQIEIVCDWDGVRPEVVYNIKKAQGVWQQPLRDMIFAKLPVEPAKTWRFGGMRVRPTIYKTVESLVAAADEYYWVIIDGKVRNNPDPRVPVNRGSDNYHTLLVHLANEGALEGTPELTDRHWSRAGSVLGLTHDESAAITLACEHATYDLVPEHLRKYWIEGLREQVAVLAGNTN